MVWNIVFMDNFLYFYSEKSKIIWYKCTKEYNFRNLIILIKLVKPGLSNFHVWFVYFYESYIRLMTVGGICQCALVIYIIYSLKSSFKISYIFYVILYIHLYEIVYLPKKTEMNMCKHINAHRHKHTLLGIGRS